MLREHLLGMKIYACLENAIVRLPVGPNERIRSLQAGSKEEEDVGQLFELLRGQRAANVINLSLIHI